MSKLQSNKSKLELNYIGLRRLFEKEGNQKALCDLVFRYIREKYTSSNMREKILNEPIDPFFIGIQIAPKELEESLQGCLSDEQRQRVAVILLCNNVEPQNELRKCISIKYFSDYDLLYRKGIITAEEYLSIFKSNYTSFCWIDNINKFWLNDLYPYRELNLEGMISSFAQFLRDSMDNRDRDIFNTAFTIIVKHPYTKYHEDIAAFITNNNQRISESHVSQMQTFFDKYDEEQFYSMIFNRPDVLRIVLGDSVIRKIFDEKIKDFDDAGLVERLFNHPELIESISDNGAIYRAFQKKIYTDKLLEMIYQGKILLITNAMGLIFPEKEEGTKIINAWIESEEILLIDIYLDYMLTGSWYSNDELDARHINAKKEEAQKKAIIEPVKKTEE